MNSIYDYLAKRKKGCQRPSERVLMSSSKSKNLSFEFITQSAVKANIFFWPLNTLSSEALGHTSQLIIPPPLKVRLFESINQLQPYASSISFFFSFLPSPFGFALAHYSVAHYVFKPAKWSLWFANLIGCSENMRAFK